MSISSFFIITKNGDIILYRDFQNEIKNSHKIFLKFLFTNNEYEECEEKSSPPIININGLNFFYKKNESLYYVISTLENYSPSYYQEIINLIIKILENLIKDLTEGLIIKNSELINEIIEELFTYGCPQFSDTDGIKEYLITEPVTKLIDNDSIFSLLPPNFTVCRRGRNTTMNSSLNVYTDLYEKITCLFNKEGHLASWGVDGQIKIKHNLKDNTNSELKIVLTNDINYNGNNYNIKLNKCNFYRGARYEDFEEKKTLHVIPYEKEFILMNYRLDDKFIPPFKFFLIVEEYDYLLEFKIKLISTFDTGIKAGNIRVNFNAPKDVKNVKFEIDELYQGIQKVEYNEINRICKWSIIKMNGNEEKILNTKFNLIKNNPGKSRKEIGPIHMTFEIINYNISGLKIKELKIITNNNTDKNLENNIYKYVRTYTKAQSYVIRFD